MACKELLVTDALAYTSIRSLKRIQYGFNAFF